MALSFHVQNFGCRAEQADGAALERQLLQRGFAAAEHSRQADIIVLNTCTVTAAADQDARAAIRRAHRENPGCKILVTGCYAQRAPQEVAAIDGVTWVVGNSHKQHIPAMLAPSPNGFVPASALTAAEVRVGDIFAHTELLAAPVFDGALRKTRPNLKVQDGCNNRCSFCVIPSVRGNSRSLPLDEVLREVNVLVSGGYREIVISGINLGRWGRDLDSGLRFEQLVRVVLEQTSLERLRISSVEPMDWSDELIALVATSPRIAKHAHLPLQSGSDRILRAMHRRYRPWHYEQRVRKLRALMPQAAIGADVMVGFPGESDELFEESRSFIASLPFTYLHVFTYSPRPGTAAATMPQQVPVQVARERNRILRDLAAEKNLEFRRSLLGSTISAITLDKFAGGHTEALSDNYLKVGLAGRHEANEILEISITGVSSAGLLGSVV